MNVDPTTVAGVTASIGENTIDETTIVVTVMIGVTITTVQATIDVIPEMAVLAGTGETVVVAMIAGTVGTITKVAGMTAESVGTAIAVAMTARPAQMIEDMTVGQIVVRGMSNSHGTQIGRSIVWQILIPKWSGSVLHSARRSCVTASRSRRKTKRRRH